MAAAMILDWRMLWRYLAEVDVYGAGAPLFPRVGDRLPRVRWGRAP